jgi:hypothetical protein
MSAFRSTCLPACLSISGGRIISRQANIDWALKYAEKVDPVAEYTAVSNEDEEDGG